MDFDFSTIRDKGKNEECFAGIGIRRWPVHRNENVRGKDVIMIHSPVGTQAVFGKNTPYKIVVSGFCTSLFACRNYLRTVFIQGEISLMRQGTVPEWGSLMHYLRERFSNRVIFTPHPGQLQDGVLENYIKTEEGTNAIKLVKQLVIRGQA